MLVSADFDAAAIRTQMAGDFLADCPDRARGGPVAWFGGKGILAPRLLPLLPPMMRYVEPYAGGASLFFNRPPSSVEVLNDLDGRIVNLYRVLADPETFAQLAQRLAFTPVSRDIFAAALAERDSADPVRAAWGFFTAQNQGFAGQAETRGEWGRAMQSRGGMAAQVSKWRGRLGALGRFHARLSRPQIENRDALAVFGDWDDAETLFYVDPPYAPATRRDGEYAHEADDGHHAALVARLLDLRGAVALSGYDTPLYAPLIAAGWQATRFDVSCFAATRGKGSPRRGAGNAPKRTEVLWRNPRCLAAMDAARIASGAGIQEKLI